MQPRISLTLLALFSAISSFSQATAIQVTRTGNGEPIIYLPGFSCPGTIWNETIQNMKGQYTNYTVSYAGFNGLAPVQTPFYETVKKDLLGYIIKENLSNIQVIGHSMGGMLALDLAAAAPERFKSLVIVDALPCLREVMMPGVPVDQIQYDSPYNKQLLEMTEASFRQTTGMMAGYMTNNKTKTDTLVNWMAQADRKTYVYGYTDLLRLDLRGSLNKIKAKVLILGASLPDKETVLAIYTKQYENLSNKTIEIATDSRHFIMFDQPEWFYGQVNTFLSK